MLLSYFLPHMNDALEIKTDAMLLRLSGKVM